MRAAQSDNLTASGHSRLSRPVLPAIDVRLDLKAI
jgi:hypothetical protein